MSLLPEDPNDVCGYWRLSLPESHPFTVVCREMHDPAFEAAQKGFKTRTFGEVNRAMFKAFWGIAKDRKSFSLKVQAVLFTAIAIPFGLLLWDGEY